MFEEIRYQPFHAATVPLEGSNLIEASAGTGKTYSIAILVLRLVLEQKLSVKEILMVTFTKAAVAELEERIRLFIRKAYKAAQGERIDDSLIAQLVATAMEAEAPEAVQRRLWMAVLLLDETSVLTIHSFCQQTLTEFAFETGQVFGATLQQDSSRLLQDAVYDCWRKHITTLPVPLLHGLRQSGFTQAALSQVLKEHLSGKHFRSFDRSRCYAFDSNHHHQWLADLDQLQKAHAHLVQCLEEKIAARREELHQLCLGDRYAKEWVKHLEKPAAFIRILSEKKDAKYAVKLFKDLLDELEVCEQEKEKFLQARQQVADDLYCLAIQEASAHIAASKQQQNLLTFDDLIGNLHQAMVQRPNPALEQALRNKYKAVFIDEFQDTDRQQYEVFATAFGVDTLLFYIGDPKQSIYAWRKADIFTYFKARAAVTHVYDMDCNFRSSAPMIAAMNNIFLPEADFDTFSFQGEPASIDYHPVQSPGPNSKGLLLERGVPVVPISYSEHKNSESLYAVLAGQVAQLLDGGFTIAKEKDGITSSRPVSPADIGILVRTRKQAAEVRNLLQRMGIPAITVGDDKVLQSEEAIQLLYLLRAMEDPQLSHISRALLTPFTGVAAAGLLQIDEEVATALFRGYRSTWEQYGVYKALMDLAAYFNVRGRLLQAPNGERILTNLVHLTELLHRIQTRNRLSPLELIAWLKRGVEGMETAGDEYEQRIESDEEAVKIVTIHKSKGLEYNIVLAPHLDLLMESNLPFVSYRHPETGDYIGCEKDRLSDRERSWVQRQTEQENRRLFYVALTRAVYKCILLRNTYYKASTLATFASLQARWNPQLIELASPQPVPDGYRYRVASRGVAGQPALPAAAHEVHFSLREAEWVRSSFTALAAAKQGHTVKASGTVHADEYDRFQFAELEKGVRTGNMIHALLEVVDFTRDTRWPDQVMHIVQQFAPDRSAAYVPMLLRMLDELLHAPLAIGEQLFTLSQVAFQERLHEFEFDLRVPLFTPAQLNSLSAEGVPVQVKNLPRREGLLNGIMDLFFAFGGRYYILDWKSNYLGDRVSDYGAEQVAQAMSEHNYHLQYLLYTFAAVRYLKSRLGGAFDYDRDFGGVIYLFVRGVRKDGAQGVFTAKPTKAQMAALEQILYPEAVFGSGAMVQASLLEG